MSAPIVRCGQSRASIAFVLCSCFSATSLGACGSDGNRDTSSAVAGAGDQAGQTSEAGGSANQGGSASEGNGPGSGGTSSAATGGNGASGTGGRVEAGGTGVGGIGSGGRRGLGGASDPGTGGQSTEGGAGGGGNAGDEQGGSSGPGIGGQHEHGGETGVGGQDELGGSVATGGGGREQGGSGQGGAAAGNGGAPSGGAAGSIGQDCPDSTDYVGEPTWPHQLQVTDGAEYCGAFDEMRNLEEEYAAKAKVRFAPGTYPLSDTTGTYDFALPVCFERGSGLAVPRFAGTGEVETLRTDNPTISHVSYSHQFNQPLSFSGAGTWTFQGYLSYWGTVDPPETLPRVLDGRPLDLWSETGSEPGYAAELRLCEGPECDQWDDVRFEACDADYPVQLNNITFEGGQVTFELGITGGVGTHEMLSVFPRASGTLDGTAFSQTDYFKLVYSADHHHFLRDFAVLFDQPIGNACGLKVLEFIGNAPESDLPRAFAIDCDLSDVEERTVTDASLEWP